MEGDGRGSRAATLSRIKSFPGCGLDWLRFRSTCTLRTLGWEEIPCSDVEEIEEIIEETKETNESGESDETEETANSALLNVWQILKR